MANLPAAFLAALDPKPTLDSASKALNIPHAAFQAAVAWQAPLSYQFREPVRLAESGVPSQRVSPPVRMTTDRPDLELNFRGR